MLRLLGWAAVAALGVVAGAVVAASVVGDEDKIRRWGEYLRKQAEAATLNK